MTLEQLIRERIKRIDSVPLVLQGKIEKQQSEAFKKLLKDLETLDVENGKFAPTQKNLAKINGIVEALKDNLFNAEYINAIKSFALEIGEQAKLENKIFSKLGDFNDTDLYKSVVRKSQQNALLLLDENAIRAEVIQPLSELLTNSIIGNVGYLDAVENIRTFMVGNGEVSGRLSAYAGTYVKDAFAISDRQYSQLVTQDIGFEFFRYSGGEVKGTRYFCCVRDGNVYHKKEIEEWGRTPSLWNKPNNAGDCSDKKGGGRNENTNESTIFSYLGGYNCNHVLIPVATQYVPEKDKQRARSKGYFK